MKRFSFRPKHRLLNKSDYSQVFNQVDQRVSKGPVLLLAKANPFEHPRLGLVIRKKFLKRAVDRNRLKRVARESFRLNQHHLGNKDIILMNRSGMESLSANVLREYVESAFLSLARPTSRIDEQKKPF